MTTPEAACHCGQLRLEVDRRAVRRLDLQLPRVPAPHRQRVRDASRLQGRPGAGDRPVRRLLAISDEADRKEHVFHFCPDCGSQVFYTEPDEPDLIVVSVGSFADPTFPPPTSPATTRGGIPGSGCRSRSRGTPPSCGTRRGRSTTRAVTRRRPTGASSCIGRAPTSRTSSTTSRAARASPAGRLTRSRTSAWRSRCGTGAASWPSATPTSTRSATSPRSERSSTSANRTVGRLRDRVVPTSRCRAGTRRPVAS